MKTKVKCVDLRTVDGKAILVLYLYEKEVVLEDDREQAPGEKPEAKKEKPKSAEPQDKEPLMTDAQKRYLFRILAERGIEGDKAYDRLKEIFQVDALKEITKMEASRAIESLLNEGKGARDGIPF
jgi:hypothetical protein